METKVTLWEVTEEIYPVRYFIYEEYDLAVDCMIEEIRKISNIPNTELNNFSVYTTVVYEKSVERLLNFRREDEKI